MLGTRNAISLYASLIIAFVVGVMPAEMRALPVETYAQTSRLNSGKWVKIKIEKEGMQFLSDEALKKMGFTSPEQVHVYGYGGYRLPESLNSTFVDDLPLQPSVRTAGGLVFYGTGTVNRKLKGSRIVHEQNPYSTGSYYFVSDAPLREGENASPEELYTAYGADDERVSTFTEFVLHESELMAPGHTGSDLFGEDFRTTPTRTFTFELPGAVNDEVTFNVAFGFNTASASTVDISIGSESVGNIVYTGTNDGDMHIRELPQIVTGKQTEPGKSALTLKFSSTGVVYKALLDYIECTYERGLSVTDGLLVFSHVVEDGKYKVFNISGIDNATLIWDVTDPARIKAVKYDRSGSMASFAPTGSGLRRYAVFSPAKVVQLPTSVGTVSNQDLHSMETPDLVIITPKEFQSQAERVAELHRTNDGMKVHVLTPDLIYNEFSSGAPEVTAYRKMLKMWYDRTWNESGKTGYCLLFGRTTYDQRELTDILRGAPYPRLLTWQSTLEQLSNGATISETNSYCSDNYIAMLDDMDELAMAQAQLRVGVGRMPVKNMAEARAMVDKLLKFVNEPDYGAWRNNVLLLADDGDNAVHANQTRSMYDKMLHNGGADLLYEQMYIDAYDYGVGSYKKTYPQAKSRMLKLLDEGVSLWSYVGHANTTSLTAEDMWNYTDLTSMTNKHLPVMYTASCEFIRLDSDAVSGCETMWLHPDAGIIAAIAANRKVYVSNNAWFSNAFGDNYFKLGEDFMPRRIGEVYKDVVNGVKERETNKHRYILMGDPAMRVPTPVYKVNIETLADCDLNAIADDADYPVVPGLSKVKVTGTVVTPDGQPATGFNGTVVPTLYDAEIVVSTKGHVTDPKKDDGKSIDYNDRKNKLFSGNFPVKDAKWEATLLLPEEIENNYTRARLTVHATGTDAAGGSERVIDGSGSTDKFYVYGWDEDAPEDNVPPEILYMYLNNSAFRSGYAVGPNPVFKTKVRDDSGINISGAGVGRLLTVMVDATKVYDNLADFYVTEPDDPGAGTIVYPLEGLAEGDHKLEFLVWDNAGNCTRSGFDFRIAAQSELPELDIYTDANPAISSVTFYINSAEAVSGIVEVFDLMGRRVWYNEAPKGDSGFSTKWDLNDMGGARVARGIYLYRATVMDAAGKETKATKKLAVGNP